MQLRDYRQLKQKQQQYRQAAGISRPAPLEPGKCDADLLTGRGDTPSARNLKCPPGWPAGRASLSTDLSLPPACTLVILPAGEWQLAVSSSLAAAVWARLDRKWLGVAGAFALQLWQLRSMSSQLAV
jgi:hypothetical protein